jgi:hypothetical protein
MKTKAFFSNDQGRARKNNSPMAGLREIENVPSLEVNRNRVNPRKHKNNPAVLKRL